MTTTTSPQRALPKNSPPLPRRWSILPSDLNWIVLGVGIVLLGMWLRHGGARNLADPIGLVTSIGQLTAIFGTYLALVGVLLDRKSTRLNSSHMSESRMPSSA